MTALTCYIHSRHLRPIDRAVRRALASVLFIGVASSTAAQEQNATSIFDGVYTEAQAEHGEERYRAMCTRCHGRDLEAMITEVPTLTGIAFDVNWEGKSVAELYNIIRYTMPAIARQTIPFERPGFGEYLDEDLTADLVAYILSFNGYPAGDTPLPADVDYMENITIEPYDGEKAD